MGCVSCLEFWIDTFREDSPIMSCVGADVEGPAAMRVSYAGGSVSASSALFGA